MKFCVPIASLFVRSLPSFVSVVVLLTICGNLAVHAQPEFSRSDLETIRRYGSFSEAVKYKLPQEHFPNPEITQNDFSLADGDIDPTFNPSVTEGFGYVNETVVQPDGKIIAVGLFQRANGVRTNGVARFNSDGTFDSSFNAGSGANLAIRTVALQSDGKIIVGGAFTLFNNQAVNRIMRLNPDGSLDGTFSTTVVFNAQVNDILILSSGKILVGGTFATRVVRLNADGSLDAVISGFNNPVISIAQAPDGKFLIGGGFTAPGPKIARLNADFSLDGTFNPATGPGSNFGSAVYKIVVQPDGKILVAGLFDNFNGTATDSVLRLNENGSVNSVFEITNDATQIPEVYGVVLQPDGKILVAHTSPTLMPDQGIKRFNADASPDGTFKAWNDGSITVYDLNLTADGKVLAGGGFVSFTDGRYRLVRLNNSGSLDAGFSASVTTTGIVYAIERQGDGKILIGGDFQSVNGIQRKAIARLNTDGSVDTSFNAGLGIGGEVFSVASQLDGKIILGGLLAGNATFPAIFAARVTSTGTFDVALDDPLDSFGPFAVAVQNDGKIVVAGVRVVRFNANGAIDSTFSPAQVSGAVRSIVFQKSGKIVIGGSFTSNSQVPRFCFARLNANGTFDSSFNSPTFCNIFTLDTDAFENIYAGGSRLGKFDRDGNPDPNFNVGTASGGVIRAVRVQSSGKVVVGGAFSSYNGTPLNRLLRTNANGSLDPTFSIGSGPSGPIYSVEIQSNGKMIVGGQFTGFGNAERFSLVRLENPSAARRTQFDFDGDAKADFSIFRPSNGVWWYMRSSTGNAETRLFNFGVGTDVIAPADMSGDGKTDLVFFRPETGQWFVQRSEDNTFSAFPFGAAGDIPAPGDFDGDGKADAAVFRPSTGTWFILQSSNGQVRIETFGVNGDQPVVGDYDGDGRADIAIWRPSQGIWFINRSTAGIMALQFGVSTDKALTADFTGDGKSDVAVWRPSTGFWYVLRSEDLGLFGFPFGSNGDQPTPGDYDGDGKSDAAVFRPSTGVWYAQQSATSGTTIAGWGTNGDRAIPNAFVR